MVGWDLFKKAYSVFLGAGENSSISSIAGTLSIRSGINNPSFNFFIVDNITNNLQKNIFMDNFQCDGFVASFTDSRSNIANWSDNLRFLGTGMLMTLASTNITPIEVDNSITIKSIKNGGSVVNDHCMIIELVKGVKNYKQIVEKNIDDLYIYVAYINNSPVGTVIGIKIKDSVFILNTATISEYQNKGVLSALSNASILETNAKSYSGIVTSEYSQKVARSLGFKLEQPVDMWINKKGVK